MAVTINGTSGVTYPAGGTDNVAGAGVGTTDTQTLSNKTIASLVTTGTATFGGIIDTGSTGQIQFPATQNPSSNANTLDDYEEGTWTPAITGDSGTVGAFAVRIGTYTKIGNTVRLYVHISFSKGSLGGTIYLSGIPFSATNYEGAVAVYHTGFATPYVSLGYYPNQGAVVGGITTMQSNGTRGGLTSADLNASGNYFLATITYQTA